MEIEEKPEITVEEENPEISIEKQKQPKPSKKMEVEESIPLVIPVIED
jgi:hypothetical protein